MRVHGDKIIERRLGIEGLKRYQDARAILREDFKGLCGYCGKNSMIIREKYHIDHLVPKSLDADKECDYYNLVFACPKCNTIKSDKWPTGDKNKLNDGMIGFIDPVEKEYDIHLFRNEEGYIEASTDLGVNICNSLHFDIRRTDIPWKIQVISDMKSILASMNSKGTLLTDQKDFYICLDEQLQKMLDYIFEIGE